MNYRFTSDSSLNATYLRIIFSLIHYESTLFMYIYIERFLMEA